MKRGLDARDFTLATFGGSGSLLACRLVDVLGLAGAVVPPDPGNVSAFGLLTVDVRTDHVRTDLQPHEGLDLERVRRVFAELEREAGEALAAEGFPDGRIERSADLRYAGQAYEVRVPVPAGSLDADSAGAVAAAFHSAHQALYGYAFLLDQAGTTSGSSGSTCG